MCDFAGTEVDFWSWPESWDFGRDHSSHHNHNGWMGGIPMSWISHFGFSLNSYFLLLLNSSVDQLLLAIINWPKTKTLRQQLAVSHWWNIWFEGYCRAIDGYCHAIDDVGGCHVNVLSPPCLVLGRGNRASVIVFRWLEVIAIVNSRRKVIAQLHWLKTKPSPGDTLGLQFGTRWVLVYWISELTSK